MKKGDSIIGNNGLTYTLIESIGKGGQAKVWKVRDEASKKFYACKEYKRDPKNVRANIEDLIRIGAIKDNNGNTLNSIIMPLTIIDCAGNSFAYIMELVDLKDYTTLKKAWSQPGKYPTPFAICNIVKNFAYFFERLHLGHGLCYKDVNEGNIFFNPKSGDIKIIDNDNIGLASKQTIKGTPHYMAPEVILGKAPDATSDRFSFAVFMYRLLVGGYPFEGPYTDSYCRKHDILLNDPEAAKELLGNNPVFVWHPTDKRNAITGYTDAQHRGQAACWKRLPQVVKDLFMKTFVTNISAARAAERTTDVAWRKTFETLEKNLITCPFCKARTFAEAAECFECEKSLPKAKAVTPKFHRVTVTVLSAGEDKKQISLSLGTTITGDKVSKNLASENLLQILYNERSQKIGAKNLSRSAWTVATADGRKVTCEPGKVVALEVGTIIVVIPKVAQLNVKAIA